MDANKDYDNFLERMDSVEWTIDLSILDSDVEEAIEHHGIKGMKWGVRRDPQQLRKARGVRPWENVTDEVRSKVREHRMAKKSKSMSSMSDSELRSYTERLRNENNLKRLAKNDKRNKVKAKEYRKRHTMTNDELKKKVERYQLEDNLIQQSKLATKDSRDLANKVIKEASKMALNQFTDDKGKNFSATGDPLADTLLSSILKQTKERNVLQSGILESELIEHILESTPSDLEHFGVKGMKWGVRRYQPYSKGKRAKAKGGQPGNEIGKAKSKREIRKENRQKVRDAQGPSTKQLKQERSRIVAEETKKSRQSAEAELKKDVQKIEEFGKKHGLDLDDGGGGDLARGAEYMKMWDDLEIKQDNLNVEIQKKATKRMIDEFGSDSIKRLEKSDQRKIKAAMAALLAVPVTTLGLIALDELR